LNNLNPIFLAFIAGIITWAITACGAATVFFFKTVNQKFLNVLLGFSAGIMLSASFWSLLNPAVNLAQNYSLPPYIIVSLGFLGGSLFILTSDKYMSKMQKSKKRLSLLFLSITLHNIPEGLAIGVAFGALSHDNSPLAVLSAFSVALGIGLQNFPEGAAISLPMRRDGMSTKKSFLLGQLSAMVEPLAAVLGAWLVTFITTLLPLALSFAAGAMIYVVIKELIPETCVDGTGDRLSTFGAIIGFTFMMILDVALG